ncbi:MAG TPA: tyrosine-type recombinase/integrase [Capillimicrobium sp.]|nr:tyrosine-type recombinase/integrase [Capillimicrobium sp.]
MAQRRPRPAPHPRDGELHRAVADDAKSGKGRSVPMAPAVAEALAKLADRGDFTGDDDLVFLGATDGYLDASALYRRYKPALRRTGLRDLRFHDLRHPFGTQVIGNPNVAILQLKEWIGHADIDTTMKYLHFAPRAGDADLVAQAFDRRAATPLLGSLSPPGAGVGRFRVHARAIAAERSAAAPERWRVGRRARRWAEPAA